MLELASAAVLMLGLTAYAVLGGADLGAGFWDLTAGGARRGERLRALVKQSMGPVWEANHVWLIFVLVIFWTAFPVAFAAVMSTLAIPLFAIAVGIIFRGSAFALRGQAATIAEARALGATFALSSVLVPFFLGTVAGGIASGRVPVGNAAGDPVASWLNPTSVLAGLLAVATGAHLAAVFLAGDARRAGAADLARSMRARALGAGAVAGALALGGLAVVRADAPRLFEGLTSNAGVAMVALSAACGLATLALLWVERYGAARAGAAGAVGAIVAGWALAQHPYVLPGQLTLTQAAASGAVLEVLLVTVGIGLALVVPALWLLFSLFLRGRLDPGDQPRP